jgi:hypothetical protein
MRFSSIFFFVLSAFSAAAQSPRLSAIGNYALNKPGVVMIRTEYTANVYVNSM